MSDSDEQLTDDSLSNVSVGLVNFLQNRCILFFMFLLFGWRQISSSVCTRVGMLLVVLSM